MKETKEFTSATIEEIKHAYEEGVLTDRNSQQTTDAMTSLAEICAYTVLRYLVRRTAQPAEQAESGAERGSMYYIRLREDLRRDIAYMRRIREGSARLGMRAEYDPELDVVDWMDDASYTPDGDKVIHYDPDLERAICGDDYTITQAYDIVQAAACELWEQTTQHAGEGPGWLDREHMTRIPVEHVYDRLPDDPERTKEIPLTPIQSCMRAARRAIVDYRHEQPLAYTEESYIQAEPEEGEAGAVYIRAGKRNGSGSYTGGTYTINDWESLRHDEIVDALGLMPTQRIILRLREQGVPYSEIADRLGWRSKGAVMVEIQRIRDKFLSKFAKK